MEAAGKDNEDDLYGDLDNTASVQKSAAPSKIQAVRQINIQHEREEIRNLNNEVEMLKRENELLKRNMGMLYRTAKKELQRKDASILQMKMELDSRKF